MISNEFCSKCGTHYSSHAFGAGFPQCSKNEVLDTRDTEIARLKSILNQINNWIVCSCIASADDMMQSAGWVERITNPEYTGNGSDDESTNLE